METPTPSPTGDTLTPYQTVMVGHADALVAISATAAFLVALIAGVVLIKVLWH